MREFVPQQLWRECALRHCEARASSRVGVPPAASRILRLASNVERNPASAMRDLMRVSRLPEGQRPGNKPAQGNALGHRMTTDKALKGRDNWCCPFRAYFIDETGTQGVALGWLVGAPLVLVAASVRFFIRSSGTGGAA